MVQLKSEQQYFNCAKVVVILWAINICFQFLCFVAKYFNYRDKVIPEAVVHFESLTDSCFVIAIVAVFNVTSFSSYVLAAVMTVLFVLLHYIFGYMQFRFLPEYRGFLASVAPAVPIIILYLNYLINDQDVV